MRIINAHVRVTLEFDKPTKDLPNNRAMITEDAEFDATGINVEEICRTTASIAAVKMLAQLHARTIAG